MKAIILCGGKGTRLREMSEFVPKPMVEIGGRPILWHIMRTYAHYGIREFILCLGHKSQVIKQYFLNYRYANHDFKVRLADRTVEVYGESHAESGWEITLAFTGIEAMTGARVLRAAHYLDEEDDTFLLAYGDAVSDLSISDVIEFHRSHSGLATITGVAPPSRFGELETKTDGRVLTYREKPQTSDRGMINGGFFVLDRAFLDYVPDDDSCILERAPLEKCARDGNLHMFRHDGFWQCMDTHREWEILEDLWQSPNCPWRVW